ncbi:hypothetical protein [Streptomyces sp. NPDC002276]
MHRTRLYRNWPDRDGLMNAALLQHSGTVELEDTGDLRHDPVDYLVALADLLSTTTGRALQQVVDHAVARGELPPVDGYFLAGLRHTAGHYGRAPTARGRVSDRRGLSVRHPACPN